MAPKPMLDVQGLTNIKGTLSLMLEVMPDHIQGAQRWSGYDDCVAALETAAADIDHAIGSVERALEAQEQILTEQREAMDRDA
jgi:hypothetical protein